MFSNLVLGQIKIVHKSLRVCRKEKKEYILVAYWGQSTECLAPLRIHYHCLKFSYKEYILWAKTKPFLKNCKTFPPQTYGAFRITREKSTVRARLIAGKQRKVMRIRSISFYVQKRLSNYEQTHEETSTTSVLNTDTLYVWKRIARIFYSILQHRHSFYYF